LLTIVTKEGIRASRATDGLNLSARVILSNLCQLIQVDVGGEQVVLLHLTRVDLENLKSAVLVRQADLKVELEASRAEHCLIDHINAIGHADDENVVEAVDSIEFG